MDVTAVTDDLATVLFALDTGRLTTGAVTGRITEEVVRWALGRGWTARREARVTPPELSPTATHLGFIDVIVRRAPPEPDLAIEIDSADKPWSVAKLRYAAAAGYHAIWVRWGDDEWAGIYDDVDVIQLRLQRLGASRPATDQLALWELRRR